MKKITILFFHFLFAFLLNAQENVVKYTTTDLNMRDAPNTSSRIVKKLPKGTPVTIAEDCDCKWVPISYKGQTGYASTKYLTKHKVSYSVSTHNSSAVKHYTNSKGRRVQSPTHYNSAPAGATALCRDGTYSFSESRRGTCSHHGGVDRWLR